MSELRIGFVPLTDAAVLIAAAELGFAEREGLTIRLEREASWATLRDRLVLGIVDAAHMLAPLAIATSLGLGPGPALPLVAPFALNLNGNAITLSMRLWRELGAAEDATPAQIAARLGDEIARRRAAGEPPLTFATVFPYSTHTFLLRAFFRLGGVDPDAVRLTVVPPPYTVDALRTDVIDGFCVGSPWNSVAVAAGLGRIVAIGPDLVPDAPEKVLAWPRGRLPESDAGPLLRALQAAGDWCGVPGNRSELATLLAEPRHLGVDRAVILTSLDGRLALSRAGPIRSAPDYIRFGGAVHRPSLDQARWIFRSMAEAGLVAGRHTEESALLPYRQHPAPPLAATAD